MIVAVHSQALNAAFGSNAWAEVQPAVNSYVARMRALGVPATLLLLDRPGASGITGMSPAPAGDAASAAALIRAKALASNPRPAAVLLVGGDEVVPMFRLPKGTTVPKDKDFDIPTDNPYGSLSADERRWIDPEMAVGRIAAGPGDGHMELAAQLERAIEMRSAHAALSGSMVLSNLEWLDASREVARNIADLPTLFESAPQYRLMLSNVVDLSRRVLFFNLHGVKDHEGWYGGKTSAPWQALTPAELGTANVRGSVVFACNCYGAAIAGRSAGNSVALSILRRGAAAFVGSTGYALGALPPKTVDFSEDLAVRFFQNLREKRTPGMALHRARRSYVRSRFANGSLDNCDYKTAMQFVFYGDPLL